MLASTSPNVDGTPAALVADKQAQLPIKTSDFDTLAFGDAIRMLCAVAASRVASLRHASAGHATGITVPQHIARFGLTTLFVAAGALLFASQIGATLH